MTEGDDAGVWLTKAEFAERRQISQASADRLIRRQGWRRQPGNDGRVRVLVPPGALGQREHRPPEGYPREAPPEGADPVETVLTALREAHAGEIHRLTEALTVERSRVDALLKAGDDHRAEIVAIEAKLAAETARADDARRQVHELASRVMALQGEADREREAAKAAERQTEAEHTHGIDLEARITGLHDLLADAEHRLVDAERGRTTALEQLDAMDRAEVARRGKGRWARLRAAWRGS
jgi:hypothetical protein